MGKTKKAFFSPLRNMCVRENAYSKHEWWTKKMWREDHWAGRALDWEMGRSGVEFLALYCPAILT